MIAVIGGTGKLGRGLVSRLAVAGHNPVIGSRKPEKAKRVAEELSERTGEEIGGVGNLEAARKADIVFLSIPAAAIEEIVNDISPGLEDGDLLISVVVPIERTEAGFTVQESELSAAEIISKKAPDGVSIASAFQVVPAKNLRKFEEPLDSDIPVCGDDSDAKEKVFVLVEDFPGAKPIDAGPLSNSELIESTATLLVELTRIHGQEASIRFEGIE